MKHGLLLLGLFWSLYATVAMAEVKEPPFADKPFAETKIALQVTDADPKKHALVLNVASNLQKIYGPDKIAIEVVTYGPGLSMLMAKKNKFGKRISSLAAGGIEFRACNNTYQTIIKKSGKTPPLLKSASLVPAGVVRLVKLSGKGYTIISP